MPPPVPPANKGRWYTKNTNRTTDENITCKRLPPCPSALGCLIYIRQGQLLKQGASGPAALAGRYMLHYCLLFDRTSGEFRLDNHPFLLRSHARDQQKNNKRAGKRPAPSRHAAQMAGLHCRFCLFPCSCPPPVWTPASQGPTSPSRAPSR